MTFLSLVLMLYHWVAGDSYELRPLNYVHVIFSCNNFLFKRDMKIVETLDHCFGKGFIRGSKNTWIPYSLSSGQAALTFCLLRITWLLTCLVNDFVRLLPIGQVSFKSYSLSKKIYLSQANGRDFFSSPVTMLNSCCRVCVRFQYTGLTMRPTQYLRRLILQFWKPSWKVCLAELFLSLSGFMS